MARQDDPSKLVVAVTGAAGYVGTRVIEALVTDERVERVLAFDVRVPGANASEKVVWDVLDVRNPNLESRLAGVDVLIHLAFIMDPIKDEAEMRDVNVEGSQNVFRCAARAGVLRAVYTSSATVYGAHPNNDIPLTEDSPLRANLDFSYPAHKLEVEYVVREVEEEFPGFSVTVLRPAIVFGPHVDNAWSHLLEQPFLFSVAGHRPAMQFIHEDDLAAAIVFAVKSPELKGPYNVAPHDSLDQDELLAILGKRRIDLPEPLAFQVLDRMWSLGLGEAPAGILHYVMHPWVLSSQKLEESGFRCKTSSEDAFRQAAARAKERVRLGRRSVPRRDLRRVALASTAATGLVAAWRIRKRTA